MSRRVVFITGALPNPFYGGGAFTTYGVVEAFLSRGYKIHLIYFSSLRWGKENKIRLELEQKSIDLIFIPVNSKINKLARYVFGLVCPSVSGLASYLAVRKKVLRILSGINPDIMVVYNWEGLAAAYGLNGFPKIGIVGDPLNLSLYYRNKLELKHKDKNIFYIFFMSMFIGFKVKSSKRIMKFLLKECGIRGAFAAHHAVQLSVLEAGNCQYFRTPIVDLASGSIRDRRIAGKPKILLLGHLKGIATLSGIDLFASDILGIFEREFGVYGYQVHIVGGFPESLKGDLRKKLEHPSVIFRGPVYPMDEEFSTSHLLLVPTPINLGIRVRILTAFSFGVPVAAHMANKQGIPELVHEDNCLLAPDGESLAYQAVRLAKDKSLQDRLSIRARLTYEKYFTTDTAGRKIIEQAESLLR